MTGLSRQASDVRVNEVNLSATIIQNSNAIAAAVAVASRGPIGPTYYDSYDNFSRDFGDANIKVSYDHYGIYDYFRDGNGIWVARAVTSSTDSLTAATYGCSSVGTTGQSVTPAYSTAAYAGSVRDPNAADFTVGTDLWPVLTFGAGASPVYLFYSKKGPGSYSKNVGYRIKSYNLDPVPFLTTTPLTSGGYLDSGASGNTYRYYVAAFNDDGQVYFPAMKTAIMPATSTGAVTLNWGPVPGAAGYIIYGRSSTGTNYTINVVGGATLTWTDDGLNSEDSTGTAYPAYANTPIITSAADCPISSKFTLYVYDAEVSSTSPAETFTCSVTDLVDELGQQMETKQRVNLYSQYLGVVSNVDSYLDPSTIRLTSTVTTVAGTSVTLSTVWLGAGQSGAAPTTAEINAAWGVFTNTEKYVVDVMMNNGRATAPIQTYMDQVAQTRADCIAFLDTPSLAQSAQGALDYRNITLNLNSSYSALFCSDLLESDPVTSKLNYIPPSGAMAGLLARTTRVSYAYRSIAGLNRGLVNCLGVRELYEDTEATRLANAQVNYMRKFLGKGIPLWEQWTLSSSANALQFINVRVLCNVIKRSVREYLLYSLQEPGDDTLRKQIVYGISQYLDLIVGTRGIKSYRIVCNSTNNPASLTNVGKLKILVYIVPTIAVREIELTLAIGKEGLEMSEAELASL